MNTAPALHISGLKFRYKQRDPGTASYVLDLPALTVAAGEHVLLTGGSGTGKSTLLQLVAGLSDPDEGVVEVAGTRIHDLRGADRDAFRGRTIGMIFQTFNLLHGFSAIENVLAALMFSTIHEAEHQTRATSLLARLGITEVNARIERMSVGQQQRVAVARAIACAPKLVLADEPTASLDPENASAAMELIRAACTDAGAALLCVSHDPSLIPNFTRVESLAKLTAAKAEVHS
ncbi:MAG: ABC transporter ATP-binding protein [Phycisphaerales bacterium]